MDKASQIVTILIKAPNQTINDQIIKCEPGWTIKELKDHLASVYPSKPHPDGQKLIYSGRLLPDSAILSEVLRTYDGQQNNTIHLVCSLSRENLSVEQDRNIHNESPRQQFSSLHDSDTSSSTMTSFHDDTELRRRLPNMNFRNPNIPYIYETYDQQQMYQQMVWMQQAYMQYVAQCMQMAYNGNNIPHQAEREPAAQPEQNPAPQNGEEQEEEAEDDGHLNRDWLDWLYIVSRFAVFLSLVYFYSSPIRCIMFTTMTILLYHLGMLRWRPLQNNNNINNNNNRVPMQDDVQGANEDVPEEPQSVPQPQQQQYPHWLSVVWTFLTSFFLSLIPDQWEV